MWEIADQLIQEEMFGDTHVGLDGEFKGNIYIDGDGCCNWCWSSWCDCWYKEFIDREGRVFISDLEITQIKWWFPMLYWVSITKRLWIDEWEIIHMQRIDWWFIFYRK